MTFDDWKTTEPSDAQYCEIHECSYIADLGACAGCRADEADRQYDAQREERT